MTVSVPFDVGVVCLGERWERDSDGSSTKQRMHSAIM